MDAQVKQLLIRLLQWDHFDSTADGPYWRSEINKALSEFDQRFVERAVRKGIVLPNPEGCYPEGYSETSS